MGNNVYMFFCGGTGRNLFFKMKKEPLPPFVKKMRHFDSYINGAFRVFGHMEEAVQIGKETLGGTRAVFPWRGELAARESRDEIRSLLKGCRTLLLVGSLGGGFGNGAASVFAKIARRMGIRVVAFFWMPFRFEGTRRAQRAAYYRKLFQNICDTCYFYDESMIHERYTLATCFDMADAVIVNGILEFLATYVDCSEDIRKEQNQAQR